MVLTVNSAGPTDMLSYQWYRNGQAIPTATSATYQVEPVTEADTGTYTCVVTDTVMTTTHETAVVTVTVATDLPAVGPLGLLVLMGLGAAGMSGILIHKKREDNYEL